MNSRMIRWKDRADDALDDVRDGFEHAWSYLKRVVDAVVARFER